MKKIILPMLGIAAICALSSCATSKDNVFTMDDSYAPFFYNKAPNWILEYDAETGWGWHRPYYGWRQNDNVNREEPAENAKQVPSRVQTIP